ncbi:G_PROTEIN_RECEP_F1_2 domain-containing protein [Meloidogyne graminicola]|uniref:G_PROTEIN_RECEP_F1_2 domain-containing protein n=1 Tax=Meloidogyne graminicola TaxID=189291 RepID=A0A8S9ZIA1_9BILA|nr:G_PROTEIN_RECEP_F1_2 domain-containing protein [Meloidogyne graminicola]
MDFIPYKQALLIQTPSIIGYFGAVFMLITLSVDRLLGVVIPIQYHHFKQLYYIIIHVIIISIYIIYGLFIMYSANILTPNWMISGGLGDLFTAPVELMSMTYYTGVCTMICSIIIYIIVGILVKFKIEITDEKIKKMYLSLFLIVLINIGGYLISNSFIALLLLSIIKLTPVNIWFWNNFFAIFLNIAAASIGPILYFNSGEYRLAYKRAFNDIKKIFKLNKSSASTINLIVIENNKSNMIPVNK